MKTETRTDTIEARWWKVVKSLQSWGKLVGSSKTAFSVQKSIRNFLVLVENWYFRKLG